MSIATSIFLIAVGAILKFAVTATVAGVDLQVVGVILMIAGALGLVISFIYQAASQNRGGGGGQPPQQY